MLEGATVDHVALSVGDLDAMIGFYGRLGFRTIARSNFSPAPVRSALLRTRGGITLELTAHTGSIEAAPAAGPIEAAKRRGIYHVALRVRELDGAVAEIETAGGRLVVAPASNSRGDGRYAYVADLEGNLIELVVPGAA